MKVEVQSDSSGFGDFEDPSHYRPNPTFDPRKKLWNNYKDDSDPFRSTSGFSSQRKESNLTDDDFEFVITKSTTAKKIKKPNLDTHDNYMRFSDSRETRRRMNGYVHSFDSPTLSPKENNHRKGKSDHTRRYPGLERNIDFDPFGTSDDDSSDTSDAYDVNRYSSQIKETPFEPEYFPPPTPEANYSKYSTPNGIRRRSSCTLIFAKIKTFFKSVGFKIKKCFCKSKNYFSRMIEDKKTRRRNRKCREALLTNQQYYTDAENEQMSTPHSCKSGSVYRQKLDIPFPLNSDSDFGELDTGKTKKTKLRFPGFKTKQFKKMKFVNSKKNLKPVKLHSFPD